MRTPRVVVCEIYPEPTTRRCSAQMGGGTLTNASVLSILGDGDAVRAEAEPEGVRVLLVSGAPTGEPIARCGPFVMNTREEILQALSDLTKDTFVWQEGTG